METHEVYIRNDQPTTCPCCGARTEILLDKFDFPKNTQFHKCLSNNCGFEFIEEEDN